MLRIVLLVLVAIVPRDLDADDLASDLQVQKERAERMDGRIDDLEKRIRRLEQPNIPTVPSNQLPGRLVPHPDSKKMLGRPMLQLDLPQNPSSGPSYTPQVNPVPKHWKRYWFNGQWIFIVPMAASEGTGCVKNEKEIARRQVRKH